MLLPRMGCDGAYLLLQATGRNFSCMNWSFSARHSGWACVVQARPAIFFMLTKHGLAFTAVYVVVDCALTACSHPPGKE